MKYQEYQVSSQPARLFFKVVLIVLVILLVISHLILKCRSRKGFFVNHPDGTIHINFDHALQRRSAIDLDAAAYHLRAAVERRG